MSTLQETHGSVDVPANMAPPECACVVLRREYYLDICFYVGLLSTVPYDLSFVMWCTV